MKEEGKRRSGEVPKEGGSKGRRDKSDSESESESRRKFGFGGEFFGEFPYYIGIGTWTPPSSRESSVVSSTSLDPVEATCLLCLLRDAVDELVILKFIIGAPDLAWDLNYLTPKERFTRRLTPERIFPEADGHPVMTNQVKLQRDRQQIEGVLNKTLVALSEEGSYLPLATALEVLQQEERDDSRLVRDLKENLLYLKDLKARVEEKRRLDDLEEKERDELLYLLQDELDDVLLKCNVEETFVNKWEGVRNAQNRWKLRVSENYYKDNIGKLGTKIKMEKRVTHEMQLYLKTNQAELEEQLEEWMATYDSEMERRENKIIRLKYDRDQAEERKYALEELYESRVAEMKDWVTFRDIRNKRIAASLQIQSWWRGIMVRKKLGPYKSKKQPKDKKKK